MEEEDSKKEEIKNELIRPLAMSLNLTDEEQMVMESMFLREREGTIAQPMICGGDCPHRASCPLYKFSKAPIGHPCPIEDGLQRMWFADMVRSQGLDDTIENYVDRLMAREYATWMIQERRYHHEFRDNPKVADRTCRGIDPQGNPIYDVKPNPVIKGMKEASARKSELLRHLAATRLEKSKLQLHDKMDPAKLAAEMRQKMEELLKVNEEKRKLLSQRGADDEEDIIDAQYEVTE